MTVDLIDKLTIIPSEQSADLGYSGLAEQDAVYALQTNVPWADWINPGQVPPTDVAWMTKQSRTARNLHTAKKLCYDLKSNVQRAIIAAFESVFNELKNRGHKPTFNVTDNQCTKPIKAFL